MLSLIDWALMAAGFALQFLVMQVMLRGPWREYPWVFAYLVWSPLSTVVQLSFKHHFGPRSREFVRAYWTADFVGTCLILLLIIHLIWRAMEGRPNRNVVYGGLLAGVLGLAVGVVLYMRWTQRTFLLGAWMTELGRNYYFLATLLNAILWFTLMKVNHPDRRLYLITSGMGLTLSGAAIAHALRVTRTLLPLTGGLLVGSYLLSLYVWYVAFRGVRGVETTPAAFPARTPS